MQRKPVCVECKQEMFVRENGVMFAAKRNPNDTDSELAYIVSTDIWECKGCGKKILKGFAAEPHRINPTYDDILELRKCGITVIEESEGEIEA